VEFLRQVGTNDSFMETFTPINQVRLLCAFMEAVRRGDFNKGRHPVKGNTARAALDNVGKTFLQNHRHDPRLDKSGKTHTLIRRQHRGYNKIDPGTKHQKALPPAVYRFRLETARTPRDKARAVLLGGALFFAMRSCEYTKTQRSETQKTRAIRPSDITFRLAGIEIDHSDPRLHLADTVSITFGDQKTDVKDEIVTQERTTSDLCPVTLWASTVTRLMTYPNYDPTWPVYTFHDGNNLSNITSTEILQDIKAAVDAIGKNVLGFDSSEVGTHSNRSGAAMMMHMAGIPTYTLMLIGRWASDAFMIYIQKSIREFSHGVSKKIAFSRDFFNIPIKRWTPIDPTRPVPRVHHIALQPVIGGSIFKRQHLTPKMTNHG
jgi:hypothetical protein